MNKTFDDYKAEVATLNQTCLIYVDKIAKLKEELGLAEILATERLLKISELKEDGHYAFNKSIEWKLKALEYKSTLDEIKTLFNSWLDGNTNLGNFCTEYKEITAKHENDKNE